MALTRLLLSVVEVETLQSVVLAMCVSVLAWSCYARPESRQLERLQLDFWADTGEGDAIDSGFGPFALERLCRVSGGRFLAVRPRVGDLSFVDRLSWPASSTAGFSPETMREYTPDYVTGVWVGLDKPGTIIDRGYGSRLALPVWVDIMKAAESLGLSRAALYRRLEKYGIAEEP